jgi:hypothetical protein
MIYSSTKPELLETILFEKALKAYVEFLGEA